MTTLTRLGLGVLLSATIPLVAGSAWAQAWNSCPESHTVSSADASRTISPDGTFRCFDFDDGNGTGTDSTYLDVHQCENFDVFFFPDLTGTGTTAEVQVYNVGLPAANTNAGWIIENETLDGDPGDADSDPEAIYGAAAVWIWVDITTGAAAGEEPRLMIHCNR